MSEAKKHIGGFTRHRDGWVRWYKGKTRFVAGKTATAEQIERRWRTIKGQIDADRPSVVTCGDSMTVESLLSRFFDACQARLSPGAARPMAEASFYGYAKSLNRFARLVGPDTLIEDVGPDEFAAVGRELAGQSPAAIATEIGRIRTMFCWAVRMEYLPRTRFGDFRSPPAQAVRDARIARRRSFTAEEIAKLLRTADRQWRVMIWLGCIGALNNSEIGTLTIDCIDLTKGVIDFRRRKRGKIRRVVPLPEPVAKELRKHISANGNAPPVFATRLGGQYARRTYSPICEPFSRLIRRAGLATVPGRNFAGLRTSFFNLAPSGFRDEIEIIGGHAHGTILLDNYLETVGVTRLRKVTRYVYAAIVRADRRLRLADRRPAETPRRNRRQ